MNATEVTQIRIVTYLARHHGIEAEMEHFHMNNLFAVQVGRVLSCGINIPTYTHSRLSDINLDSSGMFRASNLNLSK